MPSPKQRTRHPALLSAAMSLLLATSVSVTPCELPFGGCCRWMENSVGHRTLSITTSHARDGVWSCEGVMSPKRFMKVVSIGSLTPRRLHLPSTRRLQKLIRSFPDARGEEEGGRRRPRQQPMKIQLLAPLTTRPRPRSRPIEIQLAGLPAKQGSLEPGVPQWSTSKASPPLP